MNRFAKYFALMLVGLSLLISGTAIAQDGGLERGAAYIAPLKTELVQALMAGMEEGPLNAIGVCKDQAPAITDSLSKEGVQIGRTSHRLRNPANSAPEWVNPVLESYLDDNSNRAPTLVHLPNDRLGYVEALVTQALCLGCHGQSLAPDVAAQLESLYPEDKATGFDVDDLRGVVWVEFPAATTD